MGNRAVITTRANFRNNGVGIYLHWNGGPTSVQAFLTYCKMQGYRCPEHDNYGWLYLATTIGNFNGDGTSAGIDTVNNLDCDNGDNGTYFIENWNIVGREYAHGNYSNPSITEWEYIMEINKRQPKQITLDDKTLRERYEKIRNAVPLF